MSAQILSFPSGLPPRRHPLLKQIGRSVWLGLMRFGERRAQREMQALAERLGQPELATGRVTPARSR